MIVILVSALEQGLSAARRQRLIEKLDIWPQTLSRWRQWWRAIFPTSRCWQAARGHFVPPVAIEQLPGALVGFQGVTLIGTKCDEYECSHL